MDRQAERQTTVILLDPLYDEGTKNKTGTTLRITNKNFGDIELPHELFNKTTK